MRKMLVIANVKIKDFELQLTQTELMTSLRAKRGSPQIPAIVQFTNMPTNVLAPAPWSDIVTLSYL